MIFSRASESIGQQPLPRDGLCRDVDYQHYVVNVLIVFLWGQQAIRSDAYMINECIVFQKAEERVLILFRWKPAEFSATMRNSQRVEKDLEAVVNIAAALYEVTGVVPPQKQNVQGACQSFHFADERHETIAVDSKVIRNPFHFSLGIGPHLGQM